MSAWPTAPASGTFVNNQSVRDVLLQPGDHIQIGQTVLIFTLDRGESAPASDLAGRIGLISRQDIELSSAIKECRKIRSWRIRMRNQAS